MEFIIKEEAKKIMLVLYFALCVYGCATAKLRNSTELTEMLQNIMKNYDKRILPTKDGKAAIVMLQMYIGDMVPVENIHMHYSMDLYLRAFWYDYRLDLPLNDSEQFPLNGQFVGDIWTPDIYFPTGKKGKLHDITRPNSMIRIFKGGLVRSSQRVSITNFCPMRLQNFPFDVQLCRFYLEPYSYNNMQCRLQWSYDAGGPIFYPEDLMMFEFTLHDIKYTNFSSNYGIFGMYDSLVVDFHLRRNINYYLLQNYFPTALIVILSWVGFWIDYRSTPARVALGITTVLTITTLANSIRSTLPPVSYSKSIDYYLLACFLFVFAALVEFAVVGITDIKWKQVAVKGKKSSRKKAKKRSSDNNGNKVKQMNVTGLDSGYGENENGPKKETVVTALSFASSLSLRQNRSASTGPRVNEAFVAEQTDSANSIRSRPNSSKSNNWSTGDEIDPEEASSVGEDAANEEERTPNDNQFSIGAIVRARQLAKRLAAKHRSSSDIHMIDRLCRVLFPLTFILFNAIYFAAVLL